MKSTFYLIFAFVLLANLSLVSAGKLLVTSEHPFLVNNEWVTAQELQVGDKLVTSDGQTKTIKKIIWHPDPVSVYNLEDDYFHNYLVTQDNLIVHNSNKPNPFCEGCTYYETCVSPGSCGGPYIDYIAGPQNSIYVSNNLYIFVKSEGKITHAADLKNIRAWIEARSPGGGIIEPKLAGMTKPEIEEAIASLLGNAHEKFDIDFKRYYESDVFIANGVKLKLRASFSQANTGIENPLYNAGSLNPAKKAALKKAELEELRRNLGNSACFPAFSPEYLLGGKTCNIQIVSG
jgi:intein/homing endonuclease